MEALFEIVRWDDEHEEMLGRGAYVHTPHMASVLVEDYVFSDESALEAAIERTFQVCLHLNIPIHQHFRRVHVHDVSGHIQEDWALSDLAFYLLMLNGDVHNTMVAQAQAYAIRRAFS